MTDCVDASVNAVEQAATGPVVDLAVRQPREAQLPNGDHPVLIRGDRNDRGLTGAEPGNDRPRVDESPRIHIRSIPATRHLPPYVETSSASAP